MRNRIIFAWYCFTTFLTWTLHNRIFGMAQNGSKLAHKIVSSPMVQKLAEFGYTQVKERDGFKEYLYN